MWTQRISKVVGGVIAPDGKTIRNSGSGDERAIHVVSAFSVENNLISAQSAIEKKLNKITAFPLLIELLDLKSAIVTADIAGCQKKYSGVNAGKKWGLRVSSKRAIKEYMLDVLGMSCQ